MVPRGPKGPMGTMGPMEPKGPKGPMGPMRPMGPKRPMGPMGPMGPKAPLGPMGPMGPIGPRLRNGVGVREQTRNAHIYILSKHNTLCFVFVFFSWNPPKSGKQQHAEPRKHQQTLP